MSLPSDCFLLPDCLRPFAHMISVVYDERVMDDGYWVYLRDGYSWDGCSCVHEPTPSRCAVVMKEVVNEPAY